MILRQTETPSSPVDEKLALIATQLGHIQTELIEFQEQIATGSLPTDAEATRLMASCKNWIRLALEMEMKLNDRPTSDTNTNYAMDLAAARQEIGCRLARVAKCCGSKGVFGKSG